MNDRQSTAGGRGQGGTLLRLFAMAGTLAALYLLAAAFLEATCWMLFFVLAVIAWPIWQYQREVALFQRRLWLSGVAEAHSWIRRWFWAGHINQVLQVILSLLWATLLLALAAVLRPEHWTALAADVLFLSLLVGPVQRRLAGQVRDDKLGVVARRWPLYLLNLVFLTTAFLAVDFFITGSPDTRGMQWHRVAEAAFLEVGTTAACPPAGWVAGTLVAVERLGWHASQLVIPNLPEPALRLAAWTLVLLHAGLTAYLFTRMQLGIVAWLDGRARPRDGQRRESMFSLAFIYTILFLALPYLYLALKFEDFDPDALKGTAQEVVSWTNPCRFDANDEQPLLGNLNAELERAHGEARQQAETDIDAGLGDLFNEVEGAVDRYLDWYFTVIGEYQRLVASVGGDFGALMNERLQHYLFDDTQFADRLETLGENVEAASNRRMQAAADRLGQQTAEALGSDPCLTESVDLGAIGDLDRDRMRAALAAGSGAAVGAFSAKLLAQKTSATLLGKVASKKGFQAAATVAGKVAAKKGGSIILSATAATALCSPGGPLAVVCGVVAGAVTWLTVDKAMVEIDEALFRDEMRAELLQSLGESRLELAAELKARQHALIDHAARQIQGRIDRVFIPSRDGL